MNWFMRATLWTMSLLVILSSGMGLKAADSIDVPAGIQETPPASEALVAAPEAIMERAPAGVDHNAMPGLEEETVNHTPGAELPWATRSAFSPAPEPGPDASPAHIRKFQRIKKTREMVARDIPMIETADGAKSSPEVTYITGGIGEDDRARIEQAKADYNLYVLSASRSGAFAGDARVAITRKVVGQTAAQEMLSLTTGPLLYVRLPAGSYELMATLGEQTKRQSFVIKEKGAPVTIHLGWDVSAMLSE